MIEAGVMPALDRLLSQGVSGTLASTIPAITAPAWTSFSTGVNPGKHGLFSFIGGNPYLDHSGLDLESSRHVKAPRVWHILNHYGRRCGIVDLPLSFPPEPLDGFMVSQLANWGINRFRAFPPELKESLMRKVPGGSARAMLDSVSISEDYIQFLIESVVYKRQVDSHLMNAYHWDCFITVYEHLDVIQHFFWKYLDTTDPRYEYKEAQRYQPLLKRFFGELDNSIATMVEAIDQDETCVFTISDHGFGAVHRAVNINVWLVKQGYLRPAAGSRQWTRSVLVSVLDRFGLTPRDLKRYFIVSPLARWIGLSWSARARLRDLLNRAVDTEFDIANSRAYYHYSQRQGIFLNPALPEADRQALGLELIEALRDLRHPTEGHLLFERVVSREEAYEGPYLSDAPDIMVEPVYGYTVVSDIKDRLVTRYLDVMSGYHRPEGVLVASGPGIRQGARINGASIMDIIPTTLYAMGLPIPKSMDGTVLKGLFESSSITGNPVTFADDSFFLKGGDAYEHYDAEEEEEIMRRLKALGYLE